MGTFGEYIKSALSSIRTNKGRSFLTMLGIIIGISAVLIVLIISWRMLPKPQRKRSLLWRGISCILLSCGVIMAMEFALEQKISFLTWMRMDVCYAVMALGCLGLIFSVLPVWKKAFPADNP